MKEHKPDKGLIIVVFCLLIAGLAILYSASVLISQENRGNSYYYFLHQLFYGGIIGIIAFLIVQKINYKFWKKIALVLFFASLVLLGLVFIPNLGYSHAGAQRWLVVGPLSFQPSEFLKLAFVIYLAAFLSKKSVKKGYFDTLIPFLIIVAVIGALMALQSDAGTLALIAIIGFIIYFVSGAKIYQLITIAVCYFAAFFALIKFFPYKKPRR